MEEPSDLEVATEISFEEFCYHIEGRLQAIYKGYEDELRNYLSIRKKIELPDYQARFYVDAQRNITYTMERKAEIGFKRREE